MKKIKALTTAFLLFLAASANMVSAQNDSIYGLDVSVENDIMNLSFYSTYDKNYLKELNVVFYDNATNALVSTESMYYYSSQNIFASKFGTVTLEQFSDGISKILIQNASLLYSNLENKSIRMELYIEGEGYVAPLESLRAAEIGRSNVLTYFYNPQSVGINEVTQSKEIVDTRYFNIQGIEVSAAPIGMPYVEVQTDINGKKSVNKKLIQQ